MIKLFLLFMLLSFPVAAEFKPEIKVLDIDGKMTAYIMPDDKFPIVAVSLYFKTGYLDDAIPGLSRLYVSLLDEGAGEYKAKDFQDILYDNGIEFSAEADDDVVAVSLTFLKEKRELAFAMLEKALKQPRFDADAVDRMKRQLLSVIKKNEKNPSDIAAKAWKRAAFAGTPNAGSSLGTADDLRRITGKDLNEYRRRLAKDNVYIGVAGDVDLLALKNDLIKLFDGFPDHAVPALSAKTNVKYADRPIKVFYDSPQSVIIFGQDGVERLNSDYYAVVIANYILGGGGFSSRLVKEIREKRGLVYGVSTWLAVSDTAPVIMGYIGTSSDNTEKVVSLVKEEWKKLATDGVTASELADAKSYLLGSFPFKFSSSGLIAKILSSIQIQNLGVNYFDDYRKSLEKVTVEDVKKVASKLFNADKMLFTIVGRN